MNTCQLPPALTEDLLSALIDGEADEKTLQHIQHCPYCANRLKQARQIERDLRTVVSRRNCPSSLLLIQYLSDLLETSEQKAQIEAHLNTCARCREDLNILSLDLDDEGEASTPPGKIIPMPRPHVLIALREPTTTAAVKGTANLRGTQKASVKRIVANAEDTSIHLTFEPLDENRLKLTIQLSAPPSMNWRDGLVTVHQEEQTVAICHLDAYQRGICELPNTQPISLRFIATDETTIEFRDVSP